MPNEKNDNWITKRMLLTGLITLACIIVAANYSVDIWMYCDAADARTRICTDHKQELKGIKEQIDRVGKESAEKVEKIRDEIREDTIRNEKRQREDMKEIQRLIRSVK